MNRPTPFDRLRASGAIPRAILARHDAAVNQQTRVDEPEHVEPDDAEPQVDERDAEIMRLREDKARLEGQLQARKERRTAPPPQRAVVELDDAEEDFTPDERSTYGDSESYVAKLARREARKLLADVLPSLNNKFDDLDRKFNTVGQTVVESTEQTFMERVTERHPDLQALRADPKFNKFLNTEPQDGAAGVTRRQIISRAWTNKDFATVDKIMRAYYQHAGTGPQTTNPDSFTRPNPAQRPQVRQSPPAKQGLKASAWAALRKQQMQGRISAAEFATKEAAYKDAQRNGTLVDDIGYAAPQYRADDPANSGT